MRWRHRLLVGGLRGDGDTGVPIADYLTTAGIGKPFQVRLSWTPATPVGLLSPLSQHYHAHRQLRRCARQTQTVQILQAVSAAIITFLRCTLHGRRCRAVFLMTRPRCRRRVRTWPPPFVSRAGPGRWGRDGGCVLGLTDLGAGGGSPPPHLTTDSCQLDLTLTAPQHPSSVNQEGSPFPEDH